MFYGYPQDWIRTLGNRIVELHLKDFKRRDDGYSQVNLGDGDIDWSEVHKALAETGYSGAATTEIEGGDEAYLRDVSKRIDRLVISTQPLSARARRPSRWSRKQGLRSRGPGAVRS